MGERSPAAHAAQSSALERRETGFVAADGLIIAYRVVRSARRRRTLELTLEPDGVRVSAPVRTPATEIAAFVRAKVPWIRRHSTRPVPRRPGGLLSSGATIPYLGALLPVECTEAPVRAPRIHRDLLGLRVTLPPQEEEARGVAVESTVRGWLRRQAELELRSRAERWGAVSGLQPQRVLVRDQRRRWGSCSRDGTIRLNWRLVMMAPEIVDYVVIHEITHLAHPHHQAPFWNAVEQLLPDFRERRRALREAGARLPL